MRLIHSTTLELHEFFGSAIPPYAILSHTWEEGEVSFQDMQTGVGRGKPGFGKISSCCKVALEDGFEYAWVDTCCIDKTSSSELSEAINSMYRWYKNSEVCYVYLSDFKFINLYSSETTIRWFTRGWTLQELIAPSSVIFFNLNWVDIGTKWTLCDQLSRITGIQVGVLLGDKLENFSVAQRMSWASKRESTRVEDNAYCLMGIFGVNMPMLYGEGSQAFTRLQEEIMRSDDDPTIFAWDSESHNGGLLADSPAAFSRSGKTVRSEPLRPGLNSASFSATNRGIQLHLPLSETNTRDQSIMVLDCQDNDSHSQSRLVLLLTGNIHDGFVRHSQRLLQVLLQDLDEYEYKDFFAKRENHQEETSQPPKRFCVKFERSLSFCDVYPSNWFQTDQMIGNVSPFYGEMVAVLTFQDSVGWKRFPNSEPLTRKFALLLVRKRELLLARLELSQENASLEELFWRLSKKYSVIHETTTIAFSKPVFSDRPYLSIQMDDKNSNLPDLGKSWIKVWIKKQSVKIAASQTGETMYVVNIVNQLPRVSSS